MKNSVPHHIKTFAEPSSLIILSPSGFLISVAVLHAASTLAAF